MTINVYRFNSDDEFLGAYECEQAPSVGDVLCLTPTAAERDSPNAGFFLVRGRIWTCPTMPDLTQTYPASCSLYVERTYEKHKHQWSDDS